MRSEKSASLTSRDAAIRNKKARDWSLLLEIYQTVYRYPSTFKTKLRKPATDAEKVGHWNQGTDINENTQIES